jgi:hypothetical protein
LQGFLTAQGLQGLHGFFAAQGLQPFFTAQGLHGLQAFLAAQGLQGLQAPFDTLHGLNPFCTWAEYAVSAANRWEPHFSGFACMGMSMQNCTISSSWMDPTPALWVAIATLWG